VDDTYLDSHGLHALVFPYRSTRSQSYVLE
jgi:hypothetical protein